MQAQSTVASKAFAAAMLLVTICSGCVIPYAYPHVDRTLPVPLGQMDKGVFAFRVDYTADSAHGRWDRLTTGYEISSIVLSGKQAIPRQTRLALARGVFLFAVALNHDLRTDDYVEVRLYRRGYRVIVLDNIGKTSLDWVPVKSTLEQELCIGTMFSHHQSPLDLHHEHTSPPQPRSAEQVFEFTTTKKSGFREACGFGDREYEDLAQSTGICADAATRCMSKACFLKNCL